MAATSAASYAGPISITGSLNLASFPFTAQSTLTASGSNGRIFVQNAAAALTVNGNASFDGGDNSGYFTTGLLEFKGNLTVNSTQTSRAFATPATVTTRFSGSALQTVTFAAGATLSTLGSNDVGATANVQAVGNILVTGTMSQKNLFTVPVGSTFTVTGMLSLFPSTTTTINGTLVRNGGCTNLGGATLTGAGTYTACP